MIHRWCCRQPVKRSWISGTLRCANGMGNQCSRWRPTWLLTRTHPWEAGKLVVTSKQQEALGQKRRHGCTSTPVAGWYSDNPIICQRQNQNFYSAEDQQYHSSGKSSGRYNLKTSSQVDKQPVNVVLELNHQNFLPPKFSLVSYTMYSYMHYTVLYVHFRAKL